MSAKPAGDQQQALGPQVGRTRAAFRRLASAHVALLRAELAEITGRLKVLGTIAGIVLVLGLLIANMLYIGGFLFMGEWLFGSIGWGLAQGVLLAVALIVVFALVAVGAGRRGLVVGFLLTIAWILGVALLTGTNIAYQAAASAAATLASPFDSPGVVALIGGVLSGAIVLGLVGLWRAGGAGLLAGLVSGLIIGSVLGWLIAGAPWTWPPAVGFAITFALLAWPPMQLLISLPGLDVGDQFSSLYPRQSIEAATETKTWLEEQWRTRRPTRGTK